MKLVAAKKERCKPPRKQNGQGVGPRRIDGAALDVRTAAAFCGWSEKQMRGYIERHLVPFRRLGSRIVVLRSELETFLVGLPGCTPAEAKANQEARRE